MADLSAEQMLEAIRRGSLRCAQDAETQTDSLAQVAAHAGAETLRVLWQELRADG